MVTWSGANALFAEAIQVMGETRKVIRETRETISDQRTHTQALARMLDRLD